MSHTLPGVKVVHDVDGYARQIEDACGAVPPMCPWRVFSDPTVQDVMRVHPFMESGQASLMLGSDPPAFLVEALAEYERASNAVRHKQWKVEQRKRESERKAAAASKPSRGMRGPRG